MVIFQAVDMVVKTKGCFKFQPVFRFVLPVAPAGFRLEVMDSGQAVFPCKLCQIVLYSVFIAVFEMSAAFLVK